MYDKEWVVESVRIITANVLSLRESSAEMSGQKPNGHQMVRQIYRNMQ